MSFESSGTFSLPNPKVTAAVGTFVILRYIVSGTLFIFNGFYPSNFYTVNINSSIVPFDFIINHNVQLEPLLCCLEIASAWDCPQFVNFGEQVALLESK